MKYEWVWPWYCIGTCYCIIGLNAPQQCARQKKKNFNLLTIIAHQLGSVLKVAVFLQKLDLVLLVRQTLYGCQHLLGFAVAVVQPGRLVAEAGDGEGRLWLVVDQRLGHRQALPLKLLQEAGKKQNNNGHSGMALLTAWTLTSCPQDRVASGQITR